MGTFFLERLALAFFWRIGVEDWEALEYRYNQLESKVPRPECEFRFRLTSPAQAKGSNPLEEFERIEQDLLDRL